MSNKLISWNNSFSVGNEQMDKQHTKLIDIINKFFNAFKSGKASENTFLILDEMVDYSIYHLSAEEKYLRDIDYPYINEHIVMHEKYRQKILEFRHNSKNNLEGIHYEIFDYLKIWWTNHILKEDMKYSNFISDLNYKT